MDTGTGTQAMTWARPVERPFLKRVSDWMNRVIQDDNWFLTDFLTPREQFMLEHSIHSNGLEVEFFGGTAFSERKRSLIMPGSWYPNEEDFQIAALCAEPLETSGLTHGSTLGSVLGTGLDRRKIGDILLQDGRAYVFCEREVANFLLGEWHHIGKAAISTSLQTESVIWKAPVVEKGVISVASLRADAVLAQSCHWSRSQAQEAIARGRVSLNFVELTKPDAELAIGDVLSIRGFGRIQVLNHLGTSKKERERLEIGLNRSQSSASQGKS